ncbi:metallophosphoesterase [Bradyrhizobium sp. AUGA SZCCT0177]|uniref:metallophosphoesterase n=1 Tax=Bradyrhizobium sp. AUGA SZCCT0177 TaxID=2807665 RepID=UPI0020116A2D|nr:metallophosphoesterase [Bradyrhizobium sp. AUGA SZCCT0177]
MSFTYVIPDIHGRDDLLSRALLEIDAHASGKIGVIVTIGDYVNKGPQSRQVIERLLPGIGGGWRFVALKGNHDAMMVEGLRDPAKQAFWLERGGDTALASYGGGAARPYRVARSIAAAVCRCAPPLCARGRRSRDAAGEAE